MLLHILENNISHSYFDIRHFDKCNVTHRMECCNTSCSNIWTGGN